MLKNFSIAIGSLFAVFLIACSSDEASDIAGGTIDPNTIAANSSSSVDIRMDSPIEIPNGDNDSIRIVSSSSERSVIESSSSCEDGGNGVAHSNAHAGDFSIQCVENVIYVKLDSAVASDVGGPEAFKHIEGDSVKFVLQNVYFAIPCEEDAQKQFLQGVNEGHPVVSSEGDTLYVAFSRSKGWEYGCGCAAKATFTLDKAYSGINYTVFDQKETLPVQED
ncbi:MAG: hypothetical protein J6P30_02690 [Fibrobacter sp.]|nr:hypothetical protein [Fibrobacter sp.]